MTPCSRCAVLISDRDFKDQEGICHICIREDKITNSSGWVSYPNDPVQFETGQRRVNQ